MFGISNIAKLIELLEQQKLGEIEDINIINDFVHLHFIGEGFGGKASTTDYRIMNIMNEWKDMFSYSPGLTLGIDYLIALLTKVKDYPKIDIMDIYKSEEWKELINLRGPVETVIEKQCKKCNGIFYVMGISGFLDGSDLVCNKCGNVYFKSFYDESDLPSCNCGGEYKDECPYCQHRSANTVGYRSPYWYFSNHSYIRGKGF
jgi:hypothetical protein